MSTRWHNVGKRVSGRAGRSATLRLGGNLALPLLLCALCASAPAQDAPPPPFLKDVGIDQKLNEQVPLDLVFRDETGRAVTLGEYYGRRPIILALVYYECPMLCSQVMSGLASALDILQGAHMIVGWHLGGGYTNQAGTVPPGYGLRYDTVLRWESPLPVEPSTWGGIKATFR